MQPFSKNARMQAASPLFGSSVEFCDVPPDNAAVKQQANPLCSNSLAVEVPTTSRGGTPLMQNSKRVPRPPAALSSSPSPHSLSLKNSARSIVMVQRILQGLDGRDKSSEASTSKFVEEGLVLQHSILEELRERFQAEETLRLTQAATALDWSKRGDEILENMAVLAGVANEISKKADSHVAQLKERQAKRARQGSS